MQGNNTQNIRKISTNEIAPGSIAYVRGKVAYSRIATMYTQEEVEERAMRDREIGLTNPPTKPYTEITLKDVKIEIIGEQNPVFNDYIQNQKFYVTKNEPNVPHYGIRNKGNRVPNVFQKTGENTLQKITLEDELAKDMDVTLMLNCYSSKRGFNNGIGLQCVILNEPVRYFSGSESASELEKAGFNILPEAEPETTETANEEPAEQPEEVSYEQLGKNINTYNEFNPNQNDWRN